jgi:hypothetical protein
VSNSKKLKLRDLQLCIILRLYVSQQNPPLLAAIEGALWFEPFFIYLRRKMLRNPKKYDDHDNFFKLYMAYGDRRQGGITRVMARLFTTPNQRLEALEMIGCMNGSCPKRLHLQELKSTLGDDAIAEARLPVEDINIRLLSKLVKGKLCSR